MAWGLIFFGLLLFSTATATAAPPCAVTMVAHRAQSGVAPENSLAAIDEAIRNGLRTVEIDLRVTRDGEFVVIHDSRVDRTTNGRGRVVDLRVVQLQSHSLNGGAGQRIPTLGEVLRHVRTRPVELVVDVKDRVDLDRLVEELRVEGMDGRTTVGLRNEADIAYLQAIAPSVATIAFVDSTAEAATFVRAGSDIVRLWSDWIGLEGGDPGLVARVRSLGAKVWATVGKRLPQSDAGWLALHDRLVEAGVDGILTDRPLQISDHLRACVRPLERDE